MIRFPLDDRHAGGDQPTSEDVSALAAEGVRLIINLREADEEQPKLATAAASAGMHYVDIPMTGGGFTISDAHRLREVLCEAPVDAGVFLYCKTGSRVAALWATMHALEQGLDAKQAVELALRSGPIRPGALERVRVLIDAN